MQSEQMKIIKNGDTIVVKPEQKPNIMPEMEQIKQDFDQFAHEVDEVAAKLKRAELEKAIKKQADVMKFLTEML